MSHFYLYAECKTTDCPVRLLLQYRGTGKNVDTSPITLSNSPLLVKCDTCGITHPYHVRDIDSIGLDTPPSAGWRDLL